MTRFFYTSIFCLAAAAVLPLSSTFSEEATPMRLSEKYPDLSHGILSQAQLQDLPANTLVRIDEKDITREMLAQKVDKLPEEMKGTANNYLFYLLESMVTEPIMLTLILDMSTLPDGNDEVQKLFKNYISNNLETTESNLEEATIFYNENLEIFQGAPFDEVKEKIILQLTQQKQRENWADHIRNIGLQKDIQVNAAWVAEQSTKVKDNAIDKARTENKFLMVMFTAEWCPTCKQLKPIIDSILAKENIGIAAKIIDIEKEGLLASRYDASVIPLLLFFDKDGKEVERHIGFITETKLMEKIQVLTAAKHDENQ